MGESTELNLHLGQIKNTLSNPFSFIKNDLIIFDFDRCLIIDPNKDYDDIILIIELANYQLLELRNLDRLLEDKLDAAENDIRSIYFKGPKIWSKLNKKLGELYKLRFDMIFILENIQNVSKIIGDYYLAQLFTYLGSLFQLDKWSDSIRFRLNVLGEIYTTAKTNVSERTLLLLELLLGIIFTLEFIFLIMELFS
jgi:hypothetical protein